MSNEQISHKQKLIGVLNQHLRELEVRTAQSGVQTSASDVMEIERIRKEIQQHEQALEQMYKEQELQKIELRFRDPVIGDGTLKPSMSSPVVKNIRIALHMLDLAASSDVRHGFQGMRDY